MGTLTGVFGAARDNKPLNECIILKLGSDNREIPDAFAKRAINLRYVSVTGNIPLYSDARDGISIATSPVDPSFDWSTDITIDYQADDALTRSMDQVDKTCRDRILGREDLYELWQKKPWNKADCEIWEGEVSKIVSEEYYEIPGIDDYREGSLVGVVLIVPKSLNELSSDMENVEQTVEHCCSGMAALEGVSFQRLNEFFLPVQAPVGDYRVQSDLFYVGGRANFGAIDFNVGDHCYILSSATGNIIEATDDPSEWGGDPYVKNVDPDYSFSKFVHGEMAVGDEGGIYGGNLKLGEIVKHRVTSGEIDLSNLYQNISSDWTREIWHQGVSIPLEVGLLAVIKQKVEDIERWIGTTTQPTEEQRLEEFLKATKDEFRNEVDSMVADGSLYEVLKFYKEIGQDPLKLPALDVDEVNKQTVAQPLQMSSGTTMGVIP